MEPAPQQPDSPPLPGADVTPTLEELFAPPHGAAPVGDSAAERSAELSA